MSSSGMGLPTTKPTHALQHHVHVKNPKKEEAPLAPPPTLTSGPSPPIVKGTVATNEASTVVAAPASTATHLPSPRNAMPSPSGNGSPVITSTKWSAPKPSTAHASNNPSIANGTASIVQSALPVVAPTPNPTSSSQTSDASIMPISPPPAFSIGTNHDPNSSKGPVFRLGSPASSVGATGQGPILSSSSDPTSGLKQKRQKRLERNRESARLSRRRRKQYLEVLEERVTTLSDEMDRGRRDHVAVAIKTVGKMRNARFAEIESECGFDLGKFPAKTAKQPGPPRGGEPQINIALLEHHVRALDTSLSRTGDELRIVCTFQKEQLRSFVLPPLTKFLLWMTLQNDVYFRGGRAASERLSAARIGERMLSSGNDRVNPASGMWPLVCNEIGLSYDQEERVRNFQRTLLSNPQTWLHRHTASASVNVINSAHACVTGLCEMTQQRERSMLNVLTVEQRATFLAWASRRGEAIARLFKARSASLAASSVKSTTGYSNKTPPISADRHDAANLYIIDHQLQTLKQKIPVVPDILAGASLKRLGRRPSFESLGSSTTSLDSCGKRLSREGSFASSGSLKRSASEQSTEHSLDTTNSIPDKNAAPSITPEAAQAAAAPVVSAALGSVSEIIPQRSSQKFVSVSPQPASQPPQTTSQHSHYQHLQYAPPPPPHHQHYHQQHYQQQHYGLPSPQPQHYAPIPAQVHHVAPSPVVASPRPVTSLHAGYVAPQPYPQPAPAPVTAATASVPQAKRISVSPPLGSVPQSTHPAAPACADSAAAPVTSVPQQNGTAETAPAPALAGEPTLSTATVNHPGEIIIPMPTPVSAMLAASSTPVTISAAPTATADVPISDTAAAAVPAVVPGSIPSVLPPHMSIVPEDGYLNMISTSEQGTDEFLFDLTEEDWAIGAGFDMET